MTTHNQDQRTPFAVIVNDDRTKLIMQSDLLRQAGLEPHAFTEAETALAELSARAGTSNRGPAALPALIVTDLYMPGIDGWRFCRLLRSPEYAAFNRVPILVVSATFAGDEAARIAADLGAEAFLPFPVDGQRFREQVRAILSGELVRSPLRVLIVDDNSMLCDLLQEVFTLHGYEVETALTAQAAAEAFAKTAYDVAVLDYHLPDGAGDALLDGFRAQQPSCVCLMMTSDAGPELALKWMQQGAAAYLHKPFQTEYLLELCTKARRERALLRVQDLLEVRTRELRESESRLHLVTDNVPAVVAYVSAHDLRYRFVNQVCADLFGLRPEQMVGKQVREVLGDAAYARALPYLDRTRAGEPVAYDNLVPVRGEPRWFNTRYVPKFDAHGVVQNIIVLAVDISERKLAEAEREKMEAQNRQLQKSESLGRMAGAIAHHFNNQLQAVMGNLELAMNDLPRTAAHAKRLTDALQSARKAAEVSGLMLTYLGKTFDQREPLDLSLVCQQHLPMLRAIVPKDVVLEADLLTPGVAISANANLIKQVLTNLVANAWEAKSPGPSAVRLTVKRVGAADIPAANCFPADFQRRDHAYACLEVADAGCGIAAKDIDTLFDPFYSSKFIGRGLGLSVVLGIVRANCGAITVESQPGQGSIFRVFLPLSAPAVPPAPAPVMPAQNRVASGTILVVEDEPNVRNVASLTLKRQGFKVLEAKDGCEATEIFRQNLEQVDCVLCDLTMPRMNGWETLAVLRQLEPDIPVILASGYSEAQVMEGEHAEWPQAILSKPYQQAELINVINQVLAKRKRK